ncbi:hypothetical protein [Haloarcula pellucida]|uniref:Uncharacterized protein n=1 Tax=Haloarcula pellucida TaxID=1427151 RepID=A0A830GIZ8_9EURY|nr:hypothetical protein [Halomicroarcula pellucida]MBX0348682.1 hypothetical protein [Halomicroarcula pellucida]GGN92247.1 hypothetical protein GCM10009030_16270 [Halomicroarcula pellucida]
MTDATPDPYRPALVTLSEDVRERVRELRDGLASEDRVLRWVQEMTIRTLGRLDMRVYTDLSRQYRGQQGVLLAALVVPHERRGRNRDLDDETAESLRERFLSHYVLPAHRDAFRRLRADATEYIDAAGDDDSHAPDQQRFIAMRPALTELQQWQERVLDDLLAGFDERGAILDWGQDVLLATHGELDKEWVTRVHEEESTVAVLTGETVADKRARRLFAAYHILPQFRAGVRVLSGRAGEVPDETSDKQEVNYA